MSPKTGSVTVDIKPRIVVSLGERVKAFLQSLLSRKFLLAVAAIAAFLANDQYAEAMGALLTYLGVEGAADVVERRERAKAQS